MPEEILPPYEIDRRNEEERRKIDDQKRKQPSVDIGEEPTENPNGQSTPNSGDTFDIVPSPIRPEIDGNGRAGVEIDINEQS